VTPGDVEAFCLSMPGAALAPAEKGRVLAVSGRAFAVLTAGGTFEFRCTAAAARLLRARPGVTPLPNPDGARSAWVSLPDGIDAIEAEELLDYLRLAYGLAVAGLPEPERERLVDALRRPPPTWQ
jgi:predicted DNA-binding protein (MmcQ/YjbR family)